MKRSAFCIVPVIFTFLLGFTHLSKGQSHKDTISHQKEYAPQLAALSREFEKQGYKIGQLLQDQRFEVYGGIGNRFHNSAERKSPDLDEYKSIIHFDEKIDKGAAFIRLHSKALKDAENTYGIPKYVITAIIGIESDFGQNTGSYNPFNVYVSMIAVDYRADFAKAQLKQLLKFTHRKELDVFTLKSSYAGAISYAQFIPYSLNKWFVGSDISDMDNNIRSVANYLAYFKKKTGSISTAVLRYNPSHLYRDAVLDLADAIENS